LSPLPSWSAGNLLLPALRAVFQDLRGVVESCRATGRACSVGHAHAIEAFAAAAVDYLLKPVSIERLRNCVARLGGPAPPAPELADLLNQLRSRTVRHLRWLKVGQGDTTRLLAVDDVLYFHSDSKYTVAVTAAREAVLRTPLK